MSGKTAAPRWAKDADTVRPRPQSITLVGRRWFQRTYGNTYHSVRVFVDGAEVHYSGRHYGYGDQWEQTAQDWLRAQGYLPPRDANIHLRMECEDLGIGLIRTVADVARQSDL